MEEANNYKKEQGLLISTLVVFCLVFIGFLYLRISKAIELRNVILSSDSTSRMSFYELIWKESLFDKLYSKQDSEGTSYRVVIPPKKGEIGRITSSDGLYMRESAKKESKRMGYIPFRSTVTVLDDTGPEEILHNVKSKWIIVEYKGMKAWAFGGFVEK